MTRWDETDRPVLAAVYRAQQQLKPGMVIDGNQIMKDLGLSEREFGQSVALLFTDDQIDAIDEGTLDGPGFMIVGVTPSGLRELGEWPSNEQLAAILPELLRRLAEKTDDEETSSVLERGADVLQGIAVGTTVALVKSLTGMG